MANAFDFDRCPDRRGSDSVKWNGPEGVLPMYIADMDFSSPDCAVKAMADRAAHGVFGYAGLGEEYRSALAGWEKDLHQVTLQEEWLAAVSGVITGLSWAIHALCRAGEEVIVLTPAYPPFFSTPKSWGVTVRECPLLLEEGGWRLDMDAFSALAKEPQVTGVILCNPHNPTGLTLSREELTALLALCRKEDLWVFDDEIHGDIVMPGTVFTSLLALPEELLEKTVVLNAPSKTFNLPGLQTSNMLIPDPDTRKLVFRELSAHHVDPPNLMGMAAGAAAYREGRPWRDAMVAYVDQNFDFLGEFLKENLPQVVFRKPQATYLAWLDFRETGLSSRELDRRLQEGGVALGAGTNFGKDGEGFMRLTAACPRSMLKEGLRRIEKALQQ